MIELAQRPQLKEVLMPEWYRRRRKRAGAD